MNGAADLDADAPSTSAHHELGPPTADSWELDFSSRPLLDERGKKKWELLICSSDGTWKFSRFFPNNKINSTQVNHQSPHKSLCVCVCMCVCVKGDVPSLDRIKPILYEHQDSVLQWADP